MKTCNPKCGGTPACKLGDDAYYVENVGESLSLAPTNAPVAASKHKIMAIVKSADLKDTGCVGTGRNVDKLKELCAIAGIPTADIYITAAVKCAPPKRPPTVQEIKACMGHIADELRAVDPEVIILMGSEALRVFNLLGDGGVNKLHGKVIEKEFPHDVTLGKKYNVVVTTDPNALYMNPDPKLQGTMIKDLKTAASVVKGRLTVNEDEPTRYKLIDNMKDLDWMVENIQAKGVFAFDTETRGLPWYDEPMICMSFCWGYNQDAVNEDEPTAALLPFYNHDPDGLDWKMKSRWNNRERTAVVNRLKDIFENNIPKIAHNGKFDMCVIRRSDQLEVKGFMFDTLLMHHILWEHPPHDLEYLADIELSTGDYSKDLHDIVGRGKVLKCGYDHVPDEILWPYATKDAESTYRLMMEYYPRLKAKANLWKLYEDEVHPFIRTMFKAEWYGARLDPVVINTLNNEFVKEMEELNISLKEKTWPEFNPASPDDVGKCVKDAGYFKDIEDKRTAAGFSTAKAKLMKLAEKFPLVEGIMRHRTLVKLTGNYMKNASKLSANDGRVRIGVMIHGTVNGRPSASFLHQVPRLDHQRIADGKGNLRDMFIVDKGYKMVVGDFSQIELVTLAIQAGDEEMLNIFKSGEDIHTATAAAFLGVKPEEVSEFNRSIGKSVNFARVYGSMDGYSLLKLTYLDANGKERPLTQSMIRKGFAQLDDRFPSAARYFNDTVNEIMANNGTYTTRFGREKRMGGTLNAGNEWARKEAERQAVNGSIQSPASSVTVRTLNEVDNYFIQEIHAKRMTEEDMFLILTVHDSGAWEIKEDMINIFVPKLNKIATRKIPELDDFQFTMKIGVGDSWSEAELAAKVIDGV